LVALALDVELDPRHAVNVQRSHGVDAAVAHLPDVPGLETQCGQQLGDQHLELLGVQLENALQHGLVETILGTIQARRPGVFLGNPFRILHTTPPKRVETSTSSSTRYTILGVRIDL